MFGSIAADWQAALETTLRDPKVLGLEGFIAEERTAYEVYPPASLIFEALRLTPFESVRAVILGQDPYPNRGQAHGLAFSVPPGVPVPPSLRNIHGEYTRDLGRPIPSNGSLITWTSHGVLLLNTVLTVRAGQPGSHGHRGWERFAGGVVEAVASKPEPTVFLLWGAKARAAAHSADLRRHIVLTAPHPSPLAAWRGFNGSRPFSSANAELERRGRPPIDWSL